MTDPVLVIHGVGNRDRAAFCDVVGQLEADLSLNVRLIPVFWGDLGAQLDGLRATIPFTGDAVRSTLDQTQAAVVINLLGSARGDIGVSTPSERASVAADAAAAEAGPAGVPVRTLAGSTQLRSDLEDAWLQTDWLRAISDVEILKTIGGAVAVAVEGWGDGNPTDAEITRSRHADLHGSVRDVVHAVDRSVGALIGRIGGQLNSYMRDDLAPSFATFIGDVLVYQSHRANIHSRVRAVLAESAPGWGTQERPIAVLGHSLGGVIAFDLAAVGASSLWISQLITFGSQSPLFHVLDPRGEGLVSFKLEMPAILAPTIAEWANLWEPLDPLAFIAAKVFRLASGKPPHDRQTRHLVSSGLWTHSSYWRSSELVTIVREQLGSQS